MDFMQQFASITHAAIGYKRGHAMTGWHKCMAVITHNGALGGRVFKTPIGSIVTRYRLYSLNSLDTVLALSIVLLGSKR